MHRISRLFKQVTEELWSIKRNETAIELRDLTDFYREYQFHCNLVTDAINAQMIRYVSLEIPFSEPDQDYLIEAFATYNRFEYDRLIAEILLILNNEQAYDYLNKMLSTNEKKAQFKTDFQRWLRFEHILQELGEMGNAI